MVCVCPPPQIPVLGKHYSQRWAQEDLLEEQREGARANDKKKNITGGPLSELDAKGEPESTLTVHMLEHNRVMNVSNEDWIHVNRIIRSASPKR